MRPHLKKYSLLLFILTFVISCTGGKMEEKGIHYNDLNDIDASMWEQLSQKKIYFGHKSVGNNIMTGINDLMNEYPKIKLNIVETENASDFNTGIFAHSKVGENSNPDSKIDAFKKIIENGVGNKSDIALLKFCFVDVKQNTDIDKVFKNYKQTLEKLKEKYPQVTFIHVTVPHSVLHTSFKTWIKRIIGKEDIWEYDNIIRKNEYNELIRKEYKDKEPVFDIAKIESTYPDGKQIEFEYNKKVYHSLVPEYTHDGGHLNEIGRKRVAAKLLRLLVNLAN